VLVYSPPPAEPALVRPVSNLPSHLAQIDWTPTRTAAAPLVAVLDTGVDPSAPGVAGVLVTDRARSFVAESPDPLTDTEGHGTHVAATIASVAAGNRGPGVRILPVTIAAPDGTTNPQALARGVRYAAAQGARVINISFGGTGFSRVEQHAINAATRSGALVVAAAGNSGERGGPAEFPGAYTQVLAVAALGANGRALALSTKGRQIAIAAPGERVVATAAASRGGAPEERSGTSMAAAVATGAAVRVWARAPRMSAQQVRTVLETSARDVAPRGRDVATGAGAVDLRAALRAPLPPREDREPNDDTVLARLMPPLLGVRGTDVRVTRGRTGSWGDPRDGFRIYLRAGDTLRAVLSGPASSDLDLVAWRVGTPARTRTPAFGARWSAAASLGPTSAERLVMRATRTGFYTLEVQGGRQPGPYRLTVRRSPS
jgi:subtilisin family serine protease